MCGRPPTCLCLVNEDYQKSLTQIQLIYNVASACVIVAGVMLALHPLLVRLTNSERWEDSLNSCSQLCFCFALVPICVLPILSGLGGIAAVSVTAVAVGWEKVGYFGLRGDFPLCDCGCRAWRVFEYFLSMT